MPGQNNLPEQNDLGPLKGWLTKKQAMQYLNVGRTTYAQYKKLHGLKTSTIGYRERAHIDDLDEFLRRFRK
jgi:hypothetical protein